MPTIRSVTSSISIQAPPSTVLEFIGDAATLPQWAPGFAQSVRREGDHWLINDEALVDVRVSPERGTVDMVSVEQPGRGVYTRVVPNGDGSEYLFTQFFPDSVSDDDVQRQVAVVEGELETIRRLTEGVHSMN